MPSGGKRENAGRKSLPANLKRNKTVFYLTEEEKIKTKDFIKQMRNVIIEL